MAGSQGVRVVRAKDRESKDFGWLRTSWLFSFEDYFDPDNLEFGVLRVFNDDVIAPGKGFPAHRHSEMEIVTMVLAGRLTHRDSAGNEGLLGPGEVQHMTAGTGVLHSELNLGHVPLHMYQMWFIPSKGGLKPSYKQGHFPLEERTNELVPLVSGDGRNGALIMASDATLYGAVLERGRSVSCGAPGHRLFVYAASGRLEIGEEVILEGDQYRLDSGKIEIRAAESSRFVVIDMPEVG